MERNENSGQPKLSFGERPAEGNDDEENQNIKRIEDNLKNSTEILADGEPETGPEPQVSFQHLLLVM